MPDERLYVPRTVTCTKDAYEYIKVHCGSLVYLKVQTGDYDARTKQSVILHPGHEGILEEVYLSGDIWWKARVKIIDPPAQPFLIWALEDFNNNWTFNPHEFPKAAKLLTAHERIADDRLGRLMG